METISKRQQEFPTMYSRTHGWSYDYNMRALVAHRSSSAAQNMISFILKNPDVDDDMPEMTLVITLGESDEYTVILEGEERIKQFLDQVGIDIFADAPNPDVFVKLYKFQRV